MRKIKQILKSVRKYENLLNEDSQFLKKNVSLFIDDTDILLAVVRAIEKENNKKFNCYFKKMKKISEKEKVIGKIKFEIAFLNLRKVEKERKMLEHLKKRISDIKQKLEQKCI